MSHALAWVATAALALSSPSLAGCGGAESPVDSAQEAPVEPAPPTPSDPLASLHSRRASDNSGAEIERKAAMSRSSKATSVYASTDAEPSLEELQDEEDPRSGGGASTPSTAGSASPTDLDRAVKRTDPWIDMDLVSKAIRARARGLRTCGAQAEAAGISAAQVTLRMTVDTYGRPTVISYAPSSKVRAELLLGCVTEVIRRAALPEARNGSVTFEYQVRLRGGR